MRLWLYFSSPSVSIDRELFDFLIVERCKEKTMIYRCFDYGFAA